MSVTGKGNWPFVSGWVFAPMVDVHLLRRQVAWPTNDPATWQDWLFDTPPAVTGTAEFSLSSAATAASGELAFVGAAASELGGASMAADGAVEIDEETAATDAGYWRGAGGWTYASARLITGRGSFGLPRLKCLGLGSMVIVGPGLFILHGIHTHAEAELHFQGGGGAEAKAFSISGQGMISMDDREEERLMEALLL